MPAAPTPHAAPCLRQTHRWLGIIRPAPPPLPPPAQRTHADSKGHPLAAPPLIRDIAKHPVLSKVHLIAEPWDLGMYQVRGPRAHVGLL